MNIIRYRKIFLFISGILVLTSIIVIFVFGLRPGIDFVGGAMWQIRLPQTSDINAIVIKNFFESDLKVKNVIVFPAENQSFLIRLPHISEGEHQQYLQALNNKFGKGESASDNISDNSRNNLAESAFVEELRFEGIGPTIGRELKQKSFWAIAMVLLGISLYIAFAFRKISYPIKSWKYGVIALITLFHDVIIPIGLLSILGWKWGIEMDTNFVVALLVVMGFSIHDTIVVFDRIRENLLLQRNRLDLADIINDSINQTLARSINTSLTLVLVLLALFFFGPLTLKYFILTILVGTIIGTYSSIFVASPLLLYIKGK